MTLAELELKNERNATEFWNKYRLQAVEDALARQKGQLNTQQHYLRMALLVIRFYKRSEKG